MTQIRIFYSCDLEMLENRMNEWLRINKSSIIQVKRTELTISNTAYIAMITYETEE